MKFRNVVVAGDVGTGTTTLAKSLSDKLGFKYISAGDFFRKYALENNIPLWDKASVPDEIDRRIDTQFSEMMKNDSGFVFDTHYGGYFTRDMKDVFKILLTCKPEVAENRIISRDHTHKENVEEIRKRRAGIVAKFKKLYSSENHENPNFFDLVVDTTNTSQNEVLQKSLQSLD
jgi:predicted cytidylate kinase